MPFTAFLLTLVIINLLLKWVIKGSTCTSTYTASKSLEQIPCKKIKTSPWGGHFSCDKMLVFTPNSGLNTRQDLSLLYILFPKFFSFSFFHWRYRSEIKSTASPHLSISWVLLCKHIQNRLQVPDFMREQWQETFVPSHLKQKVPEFSHPSSTSAYRGERKDHWRNFLIRILIRRAIMQIKGLNTLWYLCFYKVIKNSWNDD